MSITPPIRVPFLDTVGNLAREWVLFFTQLANGISGVTIATTAASQLTKTTDTVLQDIPGLTATVSAGRTYLLNATLFVDNGAGGAAYGLGGTVRVSSGKAQDIAFWAAVIIAQQRINIASGPIASQIDNYAGGANYHPLIEISATFTTSTTGTVTIQFAQNTSNATPSSVLIGSSMTIREI